MKNATIIALVLMYLPFSKAGAQRYQPIEKSSDVKFHVVNHMVFKSTVTGTFQGLSGDIVFDPANLSGSSFDVSVTVKTISTGIGMRNSHLLKDEYFDAEKYPVIKIKSQKISRGNGANQFILSGMLILKGITKAISVPFTAELKNGEYLFKGSFDINRMDFNLGPDNSIEKKVVIDLSVAAK